MRNMLLIAGLGLAAALGGQTLAAQPAATPTYVEFNVRDLARAKGFYGAVFGWTFTDYGPDYASFSTATANGGFARGEPAGPGGPLVVFPVADLDAAQDRVRAAGGTITRPIFAFPGGRRFQFRDPEGYDVAAWSEH